MESDRKLNTVVVMCVWRTGPTGASTEDIMTWNYMWMNGVRVVMCPHVHPSTTVSMYEPIQRNS